MHQKKVLIVEDELIIADKIREVLQNNNFTVLPFATSYEEGKSLLQQQPDVVLIDIKLDGEKDGTDLARFIQEEYAIPFIFISGYDDDETIEKVKAVCPNNVFILKPDIDDEQKMIDIIKGQISLSVKMAKAPANISMNNTAIWIKGEKVTLIDGAPSKASGLYSTNKNILLIFEKVISIESCNPPYKNYVLAMLENESYGFLIRSTLTEIAKQLPKNFVQIHKSYIINLHKITAQVPNALYITDRKFPIGDTFEEKVKRRLTHILGSRQSTKD